jgi:thiol:disulfide interchange protein
MKSPKSLFAALLFAAANICNAGNPFAITASLRTNGATAIQVRFDFPAEHHIYAERIAFRWQGQEEKLAAKMPAAELVLDRFSGEKNSGYEHPFEATIPLAALPSESRTLEISFQGCDESQCYFPETRKFSIATSGAIKEIPTEPAETLATATGDDDWRSMSGNFEVMARGSGYMNSKALLSFLNSAASGRNHETGAISSVKGWGWLATIGLILLGGIGLNLTPCVLPMIPINLAILGAGAKNKERARGFALGSTYGFGMAAAYGVLGLLVVLTGSKFGTLNSSPWFNIAIAVIFGVLSLAMFDKLAIDFSRFQSRFVAGKPSTARGPFLVALAMGGISALLAGACVAPVVISVLLLATNLYNQGAWLALLLPFCLGLGMAIPWPIAGAGLACLPKPGAWMTKVKYAFGGIIALFGLYYAHIAYTLFATSPVYAHEKGTAAGSGENVSRAALVSALKESQQDGKPVLVDFWASWCKNCSAMEHTTFADEHIHQNLNGFHLVKFQAERPNEPETKAVLDYFGALGMPTYLILKPRPAKISQSESLAKGNSR